MNHGKTSLRQKLVRSLFGGSKSRRRRQQPGRFGRRFESLESRLMMHAGEDHSDEGEHAGVNGPHTSNPTYNLSQFHIHAQLDIYLDGQKVAIPTFGGVAGGDSIHTHDATGTIHIHPTAARTSFVTLSEVFAAWRVAPSGGNANATFTHTNLMGRTVSNTHSIQMFVNGVETEAFENYQIHDLDSIALVYTSNPIVTLNTTIGPIQIELFRDRTPLTVNNFLNYVNGGDYNNSFFHRYVPGFVLQGGGFKSTTTSFADPSVANQFTSVTTDPAVQNEFNNWAKLTGTGASATTGNTVVNLGTNVDLSTIVVGDRLRLTGRTDGIGQTDLFNITAVNDANNTVTVETAPTGASANNISWAIFPKVNLTGTIAMAKLGGDPNSATSQFFINLGNNDSNLDLQNGGFTVFGRILDTSLLTDISTLNDLSLFTASLTGGQEVPAVTTSATGTATMAFNKLNNKFDLALTTQGLTQANITQSHIHVGAIGQEGNQIFDLGAGSAYTTTSTSGQLRRFIDEGTFPTANTTDLQQNRTYVNVHTTANSDGEIRGQLSSLQGGLYSDLPTTTANQLVTIQSVSGEGTVKGTVFLDADNDGIRDQTENGRQNFVVYSDANNNSRFDSGEITTTTDSTGAYTLNLPSGAHKIRLVATTGVSQTLPADAYDVTVLIGGQVTGRDFGVFDLQTLTGLDLVNASDTGASNNDNITNLNNSATGKTLQFQVSGVVDGALVRILSNGSVIGQATAPAGSNGTLTVTTNGTSTLGEGARSITATQTIGAATSAASTALTVTIDSTIADFTSTPPATGTVGTAVSYNAQHAEEATTGFTYSLTNAPTGATINSTTGVFAWTPVASQTGTHTFNVVATDLAGNTKSQAVTLNVTKTPQVKYNLVVTDTNGNPITQVNIGTPFQLRAFVQDVRSSVPASSRGVFSAYHDVTWNQNIATATGITHDTTRFGNSPEGTIAAGSIDEVGSFSGGLTPPGGDAFLIYTVSMNASRSGTLTFTGNQPDLLPLHAISVYGDDDPIPIDEVDFGLTTVQVINPGFVAVNDTFNFDEDTTNNSLDVLVNDTSRPGSTKTVVAVGTTDKGGTVTINNGTTLRYTPAANFFGEEKFTYTVSDGSDEAVATVTVQVHPVNDNPLAVNDSLTVAEDAQNATLDVLANDKTDPDGPAEKLKVLSVTAAQHGTVVVENNGLVVRYTPQANFNGTDTFTYTIQDDGNPAKTSTATVTVTVTAVNDPPVANTDTVTAVEDSTNNVFSVLANDTFAPDTGETLTITAVQSASRGGVVTIVENGTKINYTPAANVFGVETFTYTLSDGNGGTATGTVTVNLTAQNDPPDAVNDTFNAAKNSTNNVLQVLNNDLITPDANETLTISAVTQGSNGGTVTIVENGSRINYRPAANFLGSETFTYTVRDPGGLTDTATVTVTVRDFKPSSLAGFVYLDQDNDGVKDTGETPIANVQIALTGTDDFGGAVSLQATTDANGAYSFTNLAPGNYKIKETQPTAPVNGLPITDGKDTIGSQGGTVANDEFTIDLNEEITGTNNNFGETSGFKITGKLNTGNGTSNVALNGIQVQLFTANGQNQATGDALKSASIKADGSFAFDGIAPGTYVVRASSPMFLHLANAEQVVTVTNGDSTNAVNVQASRSLSTISYRDFMNSTPRQGIFAAINVSSKSATWSGLDSSWSGFTDATIKPTTDGSKLRLELTRTSGEKVFDEVALNDSRVQTLGLSGDNRLYRLVGGASSYNLRTVTTTAAGEGEGESAGFTTYVGMDLDAAAGAILGGEGESSTIADTARASATDAVFDEAIDGSLRHEDWLDHVAASHSDDSEQNDQNAVDSVIQESLVEELLEV